jgi:hypothetical protein
MNQRKDAGIALLIVRRIDAEEVTHDFGYAGYLPGLLAGSDWILSNSSREMGLGG